MLNVWKTANGLESFTLTTLVKGTWLNLVNPTESEIAAVAVATHVPDKFLGAALDEEKTSRIELENEYLLKYHCLDSLEKGYDLEVLTEKVLQFLPPFSLGEAGSSLFNAQPFHLGIAPDTMPCSVTEKALCKSFFDDPLRSQAV